MGALKAVVTDADSMFDRNPISLANRADGEYAIRQHNGRAAPHYVAGNRAGRPCYA